MVSNCASLGAQSRELTATANLSKDGDSIHYDFITATVPQSSSASDQTWDFSNSRYLGQEKEVFFVGNDSNHIKMIDKDAILDFSQDKEHLLLKRLQTPLLNIDFGNSFEYLKFPFPLNDSLTCQIEGKGTYCSKNKLVLSGTCCTKTIAKGKYQFEGGYCSFDNNLNPTYHYYEKDHLGSIRMVVNENGTIEQVNHYYPFGGVYGDLAYNSELQKNKYIGKEFDHTSGLDWYDHGARMYDAAKGSWDRMDYFCEKYFSNSPYISCFNIPTKYIDESGDSAIVLLAPYGARNFGHLAIAIQNENGVWCLYSKNGTYELFGFWGQEGSSDTEKHNDRGEKTATDINSLFNNPSINPKVYKKGERKDVPNNAPEYTEGYLLFTTPAQDKKMVEGVMEVIDKDYNLANSNCAQAVQNALKKAGLNPGRGLRPKNGVYPSIIKNNPKGKVVLFYNTNTKKTL